MAAIDERNTFRLWVNYNDGFFDHSIQFRYDGSVTTESEITLIAHNYFVALSTSLNVINILGAEFAGEGSGVRNPTSWDHSASYGTGALPQVNAPRYFMITGRDQTGHRWHIEQFGGAFSSPDTWKIGPGVIGNLDSARTVLVTAFNVGTIYSINKKKVVVNSTFPVSFNDHFVVKARG